MTPDRPAATLLPMQEEYVNAATIAIVEDNCMTRAGIEQVIGRDPRLRVVASVATAGELDRLGVRPDLVIWDQAGSPDADAFAIIASLSEGSAVLVISASEESMDLLAVLRSGAAGVVTRHTGDAEFLIAVEATANGALYLAAGFAGHLSGELKKRRLGEPGKLSRREIETLRLIADGCTHRQIARRLGLTEMTVNTYVKRIRAKLDAGNKAELTRKAIDLGYASSGPALAAGHRAFAAVEPVRRSA
jgi:DNA-binding NarL/FixJ family response regulator